MHASEEPGAVSDISDESEGGEQSVRKTKIVRSSRACVACRRMKTRCEIDPDLGSACKLCIRTRRQCIMQDIPRRRKRKTTERVADLEQKITALTALLASKEGGSSITDTDSVPPITGRDLDSPSAKDDTLIARAMLLDFLDWDTACRAFDHYKLQMSHYFPFVVFPASLEANALRKQQPLLFFAIVTVALSRMQSKVDPELCDMLIKDIAMRVVYKGERSLELVQVLLVHVSYYARGLQMRDLNFNQMTHMAATMASDIGLGRRPQKSHSSDQSGPHQLESLAARRAWLGCYYAATSMAASLRHPAFVRWSVYTEECLEALATESPALPSDVWLNDLIRIQQIAEAGSIAFSMDDPGSIITLRDIKVQYQLRSFRQQLEYWRRHTRIGLDLPYVRHVAATTTLFVNEIALHPEHDIDDLRSPLRISPLAPVDELTSKFKDIHFIPARAEALFVCLGAIHECFDALLSMDLTTACALPNLFFVRTGYAARALRKLLIICDNQAEIEGKSHIDVQDLKFEEYLDAIIALLAEVHAKTSSAVSRAFGLVLTQLKMRALQSSKLLSTITKMHKDDRTPSDFGRDPSVPISPRQPPVFCLELESSKTLANTNASSSKTFDFSDGVVAQPPARNGAPYSQSQNTPAQWQLSDADDSFMSGLDVLQWSEQDFGLDTGFFEYDDMNLQPSMGQWQQ